MNTLNVMGARTIRSQTLGVSVGNPLSLEPDLGVFNDDAFDTIDWTVFQARQHGLRLMVPLTDSTLSYMYVNSVGDSDVLQTTTITTVVNLFSSDGAASISAAPRVLSIR